MYYSTLVSRAQWGRAPSTLRLTPACGAHVPDLFSRSWFRHETTRTRNGSVSRETAVSVARVKPSCQLVTVVSVGLTPTATTAACILRQFSLLGNLTTHVKRSRLLILVV